MMGITPGSQDIRSIWNWSSPQQGKMLDCNDTRVTDMKTAGDWNDTWVTEHENNMGLEHPVGPGHGIPSRPQFLRLHSAGAAA